MREAPHARRFDPAHDILRVLLAPQQLQQLVGLANSKDGNGNYTFSGFQVNAQPFVSTASGVTYNGDSGVRSVQVAAGRTIPISVSGDALFLDNATGNGTFTASAAAANTGTAIVGATQVVNGATPSGDAYQVNFNVAGGVTTYDVVDTTSATILPAASRSRRASWVAVIQPVGLSISTVSASTPRTGHGVPPVTSGPLTCAS